jgi:hypothetical protein
LGVALVSAVAAPGRAQTSYARFDVTSTQDTTFTFTVPHGSWVTKGLHGLAVDPTHGDELIAQFRVASVAEGTATALITAQTGRLSSAHVALLAKPKTPFYLQAWFWMGLVAGGVVGYTLHGH